MVHFVSFQFPHLLNIAFCVAASNFYPHLIFIRSTSIGYFIGWYVVWHWIANSAKMICVPTNENI